MRLSQANLVAKTDFNNSESNINNKISANKSRNKSIENELKRLKALGLSYFIAKNYFEEHGAQIYLVFQSISKYFKINRKRLLNVSFVPIGFLKILV